MLELGVFDSLASGLMGGGAAVTVSILLLRRSMQEHEDRLRRLEVERKECQEKCESRFCEGERQFARLDKEIIKGINEIKVQIARLEGGGELVRELSQAIRRGPSKAKRD
jgi:hypothetical protein